MNTTVPADTFVLSTELILLTKKRKAFPSKNMVEIKKDAPAEITITNANGVVVMELQDTLTYPVSAEKRQDWMNVKVTNHTPYNLISHNNWWIEFQYKDQWNQIHRPLMAEPGSVFEPVVIPANDSATFSLQLYPTKEPYLTNSYRLCGSFLREDRQKSDSIFIYKLNTPLVFKHRSHPPRAKANQDIGSTINNPIKLVTMELLDTPALPIRDEGEYVRVKLTNNSSSEFYCGYLYDLEYFHEGQWQRVPYKYDGIFLLPALYIPTDGGSLTFFVHLYPSPKPYKQGKYRIIKDVSERIFEKSPGTKRDSYSKNYDLSVEFELK